MSHLLTVSFILVGLIADGMVCHRRGGKYRKRGA